MVKLSFQHSIAGKKTTNQTMVVSVEYDEVHDSIEDIEVDIYEGGVYKCEISDLLNKAEGNPLISIIEAINWQEIYADTKAEIIQEEV